MPVPETSVHEENGVVFGKDQIRRAGKTPVVEPVAEPPGEKRLANSDFGLRVAALYRAHDLGALLR